MIRARLRSTFFVALSCLAAGCAEGDGTLVPDTTTSSEMPGTGGGEAPGPGSVEPTPAPGSSGASSVGGASGGSGSDAPSTEANPAGAPLDGTPVDTLLRSIAADDARIRFSGRVDFADPAQPTYSAPGVSVSVRFTGTSISAILGDEFRYGSERGYHDVVIDGAITKKIMLEPGVEKYELASGLPAGEHSASLVKRTQAQLGKAIFKGFEVNGDLLEPAPAPALKIEFIGDSITAGEGAEGVNLSPECTQNAAGTVGAGWGQPFHNANRSYGVVTAHELDAEYHLTAVSGIGLVRNYSQMYDARTMADVYDLMFVEEMASGPWDHAAFVPDVVVVALGTNDFSPGDAPPDNPRPRMSVATYTDAYVAFVTRLRGYYPDAEIFALSSQLLGDDPANGYTPATDLRTALAAAVERLATQGDARVHAFVTTQVSGRGCSYHPDVAQHEMLGHELADAIRSVIAP